MAKPVIVVVDDEDTSLQALTRANAAIVIVVMLGIAAAGILITPRTQVALRHSRAAAQ